jgi:membrane protein
VHLRPRTAPVFGALIAAAFALYGATQSARPASGEKSAPTRPGWARILTNTWTELDRDHVSVMAAGVAFYGLLSLFPGMSVLISVYGLVADPNVIETDLNALAGILPQEALKLLSDQLHGLIANPPAKLGIGLILSLLLTLWSAMSGASTLMQALTVAHEETDDRGVLAFYGQALALTIAGIVFAALSLFLVAVVPAIVDRLPFPETWRNGLALVRWPLLAALVLFALGLIYRYAPDRPTPCW